MIAATAIWDAIAGFLKAANAILSVVPGLIWAVALSAAVVHGFWVGYERDAADKAKTEAVSAYQMLAAAVKDQKRVAAGLLEQLTDRVALLQNQLNAAAAAQEKKDAENKAVIDDQGRRLRALAAASAGGKLRDPNAAGCGVSGAGPDGAAAAASGGGGGDAPQAGGLLSAQLSGLLLRLTGEADAINAAYESCRIDALTLRLATQPPPPAGSSAAPAAPLKELSP